MRSILLLARANIKRRKRQALLVGASMALATLLLSTALGLRQGMRKPFSTLFDELQASHLLIFFDHRQDNGKEIAHWFGEQPEVVCLSEAAPLYSLPDPIVFKEKELDLSVQLTERREGHLERDQLRILRGGSTPHPRIGEIWIPNHLARAQGIHLGDTLGVPLPAGQYPLVVSGIVVDPHYPSGLFNPTRAWLAPGSLSFLAPLSELREQVLGVRFQSPEQIDAVWTRFNRSRTFDGRVLKYELIESVFLTFYQIISLILLVFSLLMIIAALLILYATLSGAITADYRLIGIYKALGFTPGNVVATFVLQYLLLSLIALPVGLLSSYAVTGQMLTTLTETIGLAEPAFGFTLPALLTGGGVLLLVLILTTAISYRAGRIPPVGAIRQGGGQGNLRQTYRAGRELRGPLPVFLGQRLLFDHPGRTLYTGISLLFVIFIGVFSINVAHSFHQLKDNKAAWGLEDSDLQLRINPQIALPLDPEEFHELLRADTAVAAVVPYQYTQASAMHSDSSDLLNLIGKAYDGPPSLLGLKNLRGRHPVNADEIALCRGTAGDLDKAPGDSVRLFIEGQWQDFLVTGIYQDVSNLGQGFRLAGAALRRLNPLFQPDLFALRLSLGMSVADYRRQLEQRYGETILIDLSVEERQGIKSTINQMRYALWALALFFLAILLIVLVNDTLLNLYDHRRSFGILKSLGWTPGGLWWALIFKTLLLTCICLLLGIPLSLAIGPALISEVTGSIGLEHFPWILDRSGTLLIIPGLLLFTGVVVWRASGRMLRMPPRILDNP